MLNLLANVVQALYCADETVRRVMLSKRGKQKKAENAEKRKIQMEEALECLALKQAAEMRMAFASKRIPKQCTFRYCLRYFDPSCTVCPYCGHPVENQPAQLKPQRLTLAFPS